jgi:putative DNA primase/helicase
VTSDSPSPTENAKYVARLLREANLDTERFIDVLDGCKASTNHTMFGARRVDGNYGIYADGDVCGGLIDIDIDDYDVDKHDTDGLAAVNGLPPTLTVETPHTDGETGGHRFYSVEPGEEFETAKEACEAVCDGAANPSPSWGEIRVHNQYVVGPGSTLDDCDKEGCDECTTPEGGDYRIAADLSIATISADDLADVLRADSKYQDNGDDNGDLDSYSSSSDSVEGGQTDKIEDHPTPEAVAAATDCIHDYDPNGDRSQQEWRICCGMIKHGVPRDEVERFITGRLPGSKVAERKEGIDYGDTWQNAVAEVGADAGSFTVASFGSEGAKPESDDATYISIPRSEGEEVETEKISELWRGVRGLYQHDDTPKAEARDSAVRLLSQQENFVAVTDTEELYRYNQTKGIYEPGGDQYVGEVLDRRLGVHYTLHERREIIRRLTDRNWTDRDDLGGPEGMVCVANGVLDLTEPTSPTLREHDPEYGFISRLPVTYDPDAECPTFETFIQEVVRDDDQARLQEYAGYCLHTWGQPFKRALVCLGPTDSGKSTFLDVLRDVLGPENVASESLYDLVGTRWGKAELYGTVANIRNELSPGDLKYPQQFKEITSGRDPINAERKGKDKFTFVPTAKQFFASNQVPSVDHADDAFYNRWLFVSFPTSVPRHEQEHGLADRLVNEEASGILNWMLEGYARLCDQQRFTGERALGEKEEMWQAYGDSVDRFVNRCLDVTSDTNDRVPKKDAHGAYTAMCEDLGLSSERQRTFTEELKRRDGIDDAKPRAGNVRTVLPHSESRIRCYTGIQFSSDGLEYLEMVANSVNNSDVNTGEDTPTSLTDY